jgi:hypothetical protein
MAGIFSFPKKPYPTQSEVEIKNLLTELARIGKVEDFLSETSGHGYNAQCRHIRTRQIGIRLNEIGGNELMKWVSKQIKKKCGEEAASHLEFAWMEIGNWIG